MPWHGQGGLAVSPSRVSAATRRQASTPREEEEAALGATTQQRKPLPEPRRIPPADSSCACLCSEAGLGGGPGVKQEGPRHGAVCPRTPELAGWTTGALFSPRWAHVAAMGDDGGSSAARNIHQRDSPDGAQPFLRRWH